MPKMATSGEYHRNIMPIAGRDYLVVAPRAAGLDHSDNARFRGSLD
jgi:hypothetical protein